MTPVTGLEDQSTLVGRPLLRLEDDRLLRGLGCFVDDVPEPAGTLHLAFLPSPHAHARILQMDTTSARAAEGVFDVLVGEIL